jgi:site-specific DNA-methyltransferase (adenine-specific)
MSGPLVTGVVHQEDNLAVLARLPAGCIDLVYLDPPFNTGRTHTARGADGEERSFDDRWQGGLATFLDWMRPRLRELHRVLKPTGSLYLHCDDHASHYLWLELDGIFGVRHYSESITWRRAHAHNEGGSFGRIHDTLLMRTRSRRYTWNPQRHADGEPLTNLWRDIPPLNARDKERVGYPTQKPLALMERIVRVSSNVGDVLLDPFAGSGTSLVAAERLGRRWIGIERSEAACRVIAERLARAQTVAPQQLRRPRKSPAEPQLALPLEVAV